MSEIWFINHYAEEPERGKFLRTYSYAKELVKRGWRVKVFCASTLHTTTYNYIEDDRAYLEKIIDGVEFIFVRTRTYFGNTIKRVQNMLDFYTRTPKILKGDSSPEVIISSSPHPLNWLLGRKLAKKFNCKFYAETRDFWPETFVALRKLSDKNPISHILYRIEKSIYNTADALIFTMPGYEEYLRKKNYHIKKAIYLPNGIDIAAFDENAKTKETNIEFEKEKIHLLYTGSFGLVNGLSSVFDVAEKLLEDNRYVFHFIGGGALEEELKEKAERKGLTNVRIHKRVKKDRIPWILSHATINMLLVQDLPLLYQYGTSMNKMNDYLASGKPILANFVGGYSDLEKYKIGKSSHGNDQEQFIENIKYYANLPKSEYDEICARVRKVGEMYDFSVLVERLEALLKEDLDEIS